jgi:hypothetical protein
MAHVMASPIARSLIRPASTVNAGARTNTNPRSG